MYIIPANVNNGKLIFNIFLPIDLIIAISGVAVTLLALLIFQPHNMFGAFMCLAPGLVCCGLCVPVPNYHNIRVVIKEAIGFLNHRRNYKWEGWCYSDEYKG
jgi:hypothetical protein